MTCCDNSMKPKILDDWHWFLVCYYMVLFRPLDYMEDIRKIRGYDNYLLQ